MADYDLIPCPFCGEKAVFMDAGDVGNPLSIECASGWLECLGHTHLYPRQALNELIIKWNTRPRMASKDKQLSTKDEGLDAALKYQLELSTTITAQAGQLKIARVALEFQRDQIGSDMEALRKRLHPKVSPHGNHDYIALQCRLQSVQEALAKLDEADKPKGCNQCPHAVGDIYERDCGYPDCVN
jgi:hypothetical protein